jgi:hypothetical protein
LGREDSADYQARGKQRGGSRMKFKVGDILKDKTNCLYKILDVEGEYYYCEQGFLERDAFIGKARYVKIPFKNENTFHVINEYLEDNEVEDRKEEDNKNFLGLTDVNISNIITLKVQGKTPQEITNYTHCRLDDVEAVSKTYDFLESRETLEKGELVAKNSELKYENDAIKDELQRVYRAIAIHFLFKKDEY